MADNTQPDFREESNPNWRDQPTSVTERYIGYIVAGVILVGGGVFLGATWFGGDTPIIENENSLGYFTNLFTEVISILVTVGLFGIFAEMRRIHLLKKELVRNAGKRSNSVAVDAIDDLRHYGWLYLLAGANLRRANLSDADLEEATLRDTDLVV